MGSALVWGFWYLSIIVGFRILAVRTGLGTFPGPRFSIPGFLGFFYFQKGNLDHSEN